jgi:hypothetical protein
MTSRTLRYRWHDVSGGSTRDIAVVGLAPERAQGPLVNLVFTSVAELEELANTLRGIAKATKAVRAARRKGPNERRT